MFKLPVRFFSVARVMRIEPVTVISPKLAAKQFVPPHATKSKKKSLKRREKRIKRQIVRDVNNFKKHNLTNVDFSVDPVLGDVNCGFIKRLQQELTEPSNLSHGYKRDEVEKLLYGAQKASLDNNIAGDIISEKIVQAEEKKKSAILTILNMRNSNAQDRRKLAIDFARREFAREEGDTGSPEVQAAVLTAKIHSGWVHVRDQFKDKVHTDRIRQMVQQRQRILKYLKRDDSEKYYYTLSKLGLADDVITREFSMSKQYLQDYKVWGDKQLVKISDKQKRKADKITELQHRVASYYDLAKENYEKIHASKKA